MADGRVQSDRDPLAAGGVELGEHAPPVLSRAHPPASRLARALVEMTDEDLLAQDWWRDLQGRWHHGHLDHVPLSRREAVVFCVYARPR